MSRCVASDTTVEALVGILEDNPRGLLVHKDELAGWVRSMDQCKGGKGSDRQHWLSFWSGDEVVVDRKSRQGEPLIVAEPSSRSSAAYSRRCSANSGPGRRMA